MPSLELTEYIGETGLIWPSLPSYDEWAEVGPRLALVSNTSRWALADWLLLGEERWPAKADQVISNLGLAYHSLENLRWVARRVPPSVRRPLPVSFSHHALVAALPVDRQETLLIQCEEAGWTRDEFRGYLLETGAIKVEASPGREWTPAQVAAATRIIEREFKLWIRESDMDVSFLESPVLIRETEALSRLIARVLAKAFA